MSDREKEELRGPVRTCESELTHPLQNNATEEEHRHTMLTFDRHGSLLQRTARFGTDPECTWKYEYSNGLLQSIHTRFGTDFDITAHHEYDTQGRLIRELITQADGAEMIGVVYTYPADDSKIARQPIPGLNSKIRNIFIHISELSLSPSTPPTATAIVKTYHPPDRLITVAFHDANDDVLIQVDLSYDDAGRLIEEAHSFRQPPLPTQFAELPPEQAQILAAAMAQTFGATRITHRYDERGNEIERFSHIGPMENAIETSVYNEQGDPAHKVSLHHTEEYSIDENSHLTPLAGKSSDHKSEIRFTYEYDEHGNWLNKTVESSTNGYDWTTLSREHRVITYF